MAVGFIGRARELALLDKRLDRAAQTGAAVAVRGRRQVGKSRLIQEFCDRAHVPYCYFTATKGASSIESVGWFLDEIRASTLPADRELVPTQAPGGWPDAFRILASALPDTPSIVVIDELPWLTEQDDLFDGALQTAWDRLLSRRPVLLLLLGSDIHMMERLTAYDRPFYGRADNLVLGPLNPAEVEDALALSPADAIDAHLVSGGIPGILRSWPQGTSALDFLRQECLDPAAPVFGIPESALLAEFPSPDQSRRVLEAVGSGERTHANIAAAAGSRAGAIPSGSLSPLLQRLVTEKRVLAIDEPLSTTPGKPALYRVDDSNLRLYLAFLRTVHELVRRGRPDAASTVITRQWHTWRGRAVEPMVRQALESAALAGRLPWPDVQTVGGWWNRQFNPEVDLVGADRAPVASRIHFAGSVKWLGTPFDKHDLHELRRGAAQVPGFDGNGLVIVSLSALADDVTLGSDEIAWGPEQVLEAWRA
ncbi:ATP-binding protein [Nocardia sp. BMG111209]|uniref:ATP-binding protein n=1 Tax=Nocardia sp. BMG111209 TaxID=1160137 RepID=UPI00036CF6EC|nr:ATP-binding protein [Nocardia sp. BMG111209]